MPSQETRRAAWGFGNKFRLSADAMRQSANDYGVLMQPRIGKTIGMNMDAAAYIWAWAAVSCCEMRVVMQLPPRAEQQVLSWTQTDETLLHWRRSLGPGLQQKH